MQDVYSSNVNRMGFDPETGELRVEWSTGKVSVYSGVPEDTARKVMNSWSIGKAINEHIKGTFEHRYDEV